ncbi:dihydrofolate reductase family protein [Patescibacteria group bacterium]|nr:dihydrofolate reductase family protein [Patescibacteria group bacterium]MBU4452889.1 dihydrofolate reductase family protein [Patescibacteria group bacterium]MCG2687997.1 dihydrofolate reductase family protein [Candidatus Parcubacteria bacterium]
MNTIQERPHTTLFMMMSVDGKITSGDSDSLDSDKDWTHICGVKEGIGQYYNLEKQTDLCFLQSGRVFAKIGINEREPVNARIPVTGVIIDNKPHLNKKGLTYLSSWLERVIIITTNREHPADRFADNVEVVLYKDEVDIPDMFEKLKKDFGIDRITIQTGGTLNGVLLRGGFIDEFSIVVAPLAVGGRGVSTLIDGEAIHDVNELDKVKALRLMSCDILDDSFIHLKYEVVQKTVLV